MRPYTVPSGRGENEGEWKEDSSGGGVDWPLDWPSISLHGWGDTRVSPQPSSVCFMTHDCSRKLWKHSRPTSASWVSFSLWLLHCGNIFIVPTPCSQVSCRRTVCWCSMSIIAVDIADCRHQRPGLSTILLQSIGNTNTNTAWKKYCEYQYQYKFLISIAIQIPILLQYCLTNTNTLRLLILVCNVVKSKHKSNTF